MNPIISLTFALIWVMFSLTDWLFLRKQKKFNSLIILFQLSTAILFVLLLFNIRVPMPTRWIFKSFSSMIESWFQAFS